MTHNFGSMPGLLVGWPLGLWSVFLQLILPFVKDFSVVKARKIEHYLTVSAFNTSEFVFAGNKLRRVNLSFLDINSQYQHATQYPVRDKSGKNQVLRGLTVWVTSKFKWATKELEPFLIPSGEKFMTLFFQKATVFLLVLPSRALSTEATHGYLPAAEPLAPDRFCHVFVKRLHQVKAVPLFITHIRPQYDPFHTPMLLKHLPYSSFLQRSSP